MAILNEDLVFPKILDKLREIHEEFPDIRFTRIQEAVDKMKYKHNVNLSDQSSKDVLRCITDYQRHLRQYKGLKRLPKIMNDSSKLENHLKNRGLKDPEIKEIFKVYDTLESLNYAIKENMPFPFKDSLLKKLEDQNGI